MIPGPKKSIFRVSVLAMAMKGMDRAKAWVHGPKSLAGQAHDGI